MTILKELIDNFRKLNSDTFPRLEALLTYKAKEMAIEVYQILLEEESLVDAEEETYNLFPELMPFVRENYHRDLQNIHDEFVNEYLKNFPPPIKVRENLLPEWYVKGERPKYLKNAEDPNRVYFVLGYYENGTFGTIGRNDEIYLKCQDVIPATANEYEHVNFEED